jgi:hypothetical protein
MSLPLESVLAGIPGDKPGILLSQLENIKETVVIVSFLKIMTAFYFLLVVS